MVLEKGDCIGNGDIARGSVVQIVEEEGDLGVFKICQQIDDPVDGRTRPVMAFGRHSDDGGDERMVWWREGVRRNGPVVGVL